ncbi:MAG: class I SAM-dependent methyltransferase, partial [Archangium sp.]|nr:class I SAM-dependent methyltransferase [Archangium sp.]
MKSKLAVTVTAKQPGRYVAHAKEKAAEWGLPFVDREKKMSLAPMLEAHADAFLVLGGDGWTLSDGQGSLRFSPGMGAVRIRRLINTPDQSDDVLLKLAELKAGDTVFDGTLGLAADALVCAFRVGDTGRVIGSEASLPIFALVSEGLRASGSQIEVRHGGAAQVLREFEDHSLDVITLDPMFEVPKKSSTAFEALRRFAVHQPLDEETLAHARRVAKRCVI